MFPVYWYPWLGKLRSHLTQTLRGWWSLFTSEKKLYSSQLKPEKYSHFLQEGKLELWNHTSSVQYMEVVRLCVHSTFASPTLRTQNSNTPRITSITADKILAVFPEGLWWVPSPQPPQDIVFLNQSPSYTNPYLSWLLAGILKASFSM